MVITSTSLALYRARYLMPMNRPIIENGAIVVRDRIIIAVGKYADLCGAYPGTSCCDLGEVILMPGLINAHVHLDYTMMRGQLTPGTSFTTWVQELNKIKYSLSEADFLNAIAEGITELHSWGCTSLFNIESIPSLLHKLPPFPLRLWQFIEVMDIRGREQGVEQLAMLQSLLKNQETRGSSIGISPHAPQTSSPGLYQAAGLLAQQYHLPFCTHLAESEEEMHMFTQREGPLFDFVKKYGRDMSDCGFQTPVQAVLKNDLLPRGSLLVHMNFLSQEDRLLLSPRGNDFFIIHCPKTHRFFQRPPFDWKFFYKNGYRLLLGTDSLASNNALNLFEEMRCMATTAPELAPEEILKMVTLHPAASIGMQGGLGEISHGAFADIITIPFTGKRKNITQAVIENKIFPTVI